MYKLRDYQKRIVDDLKHLPSYALYLGTGTGKTITALDLTTYQKTNNLLVICPHNAVTQWKLNIEEHFEEYNIIEFKKSWSSSKINEYLKTLKIYGKNVIVINYDMAHRINELLRIVNSNWTIILDEMHRIKNIGTRTNPVKITAYILELGLLTPWKIGLTATPTQGNYGGYIDYYTQLNFLGYMDLTYREYYNKHVIYSENKIRGVPFPIKTIVGYKDVDSITDTLKLMSRSYTPKIGDFEPQHNKIVLDKVKTYNRMVREKVYKDIVLNTAAKTRIAKKTLATGTIFGYDLFTNYLEYVDNTAKIDWLKDFLSDTDEVTTILYTYNVELKALEELMHKIGKKYIVINGNTKDKYKEVNEKDYEVVLGQFRAIGEALDGLQHKCHIEVFFSMPESSILYKQSIGRIDRIGQEKVPMYYYLLMDKTIETKIMELIENKVEYSEEILDALEV